MEIDFTQYEPIIKSVLVHTKVPKNQREDMSQECYVALLEKRKHLEHGIELDQERPYVASICRSRIMDVKRREGQQRGAYKTNPKLKFDSLTDPRTYWKASKIGIPVIDEDPNASPEQMEAAILSLPFDDYRVIYELFVQGKTQEKVATELGISPRTVWTRSQRGIQGLKKYFGVE